MSLIFVCWDFTEFFMSFRKMIDMWRDISLWFWFSFPWWLVMLSTFSYTCLPFIYLFGIMFSQVICSFLNWVIYFLAVELYESVVILCSWVWPLKGFPGGSVVKKKKSTCQCRIHRFHPWVGKIPWRKRWQPTSVFLPGKSHGQKEPGGLQSMGLQKRVIFKK